MQESKYRIQPAIKKETVNVTLYTIVGTIVMWIVFALLHFFVQKEIPFDHTVFLGGICGAAIAILNFFLMCITVQQVTSTENDDDAKMLMKKSYTKRMGMQLLWIVTVIAAPCFMWVAGLLPLLFPSLGIKAKGIIDSRKKYRQEVETKQDEH